MGASFWPSGEGEEANKKADLLAIKMREVLVVGKGQFIRISCSKRMAMLKMRGLNDSIGPEDITSALARVTGGREDEMKAEDLVRRGRGGLDSLLVRYPLAHALKAAEIARICVGWFSARVDLLEERPLRCFKCLAVSM